MKDPRLTILVIVATLVGSLIAADLAHRFIERSWEQRAARRRAEKVERRTETVTLPGNEQKPPLDLREHSDVTAGT